VNLKNYKNGLLIVSTVFALSACGGGGGDSGVTVTPVTSFALQAGYKARVSGGAVDNYTVSGSCSGSATITTSSALAATFEGITGFSAGQTSTINVTNCVPATNTVTGTSYYDANYTILGSSIPNLEYTKVLTTPPPLPASVKVGDTAVYATITVYTDSTKRTIVGQRVLSYVVEADSPTTAFVTLITKSYNATNQLLFTQQSKFRIQGDGTLTSVSIDVQYATTSTLHLIYTKA